MPSPLVELDEVASTQDELHRRAAEGAVHGTSVVARCQAEGRGSRGRTWHAPSGGMWLSVLWRPPAGATPDAGGVQLLGLRAGLAVARVVEAACPGVKAMLKWPNDLLVQDLKVGGILCEARWQGEVGWVVLGVGLNVHNELPSAEQVRFPAGALGGWCPALQVAELAQAVAAALGLLDARPRLDHTELAEWQSRDWLQGRTVRLPLSGTVAGIAPTGHLVIASANGHRHEVVAGDALAL